MQFQQNTSKSGAQQIVLATGTSHQVVGTGPPIVVSLINNIKTLIISFKPGGQVPSFVSVIGTQSGFAYYFNPPYLAQFGAYLIVVPIIAPIDTSVGVAFTGATANYAVTIYGDTAQYDESIFYNGVIQQSTTSGSTVQTLVTGPVRLLTLSLETNVPSSSAAVGFAGGFMLRADSPAGGNANIAVNFPPNTILPANTHLTSSGGNYFAAATWAYP